MRTFPRVFAFYIPRSDDELHRRLMEDPPRYSTEWAPPAQTDLRWGDRIVFGTTTGSNHADSGGWAHAVIRFRVFTVAPFDKERHPTGVPLVGGHDEHEKPASELGELTGGTTSVRRAEESPPALCAALAPIRHYLTAQARPHSGQRPLSPAPRVPDASACRTRPVAVLCLPVSTRGWVCVRGGLPG